MTTRGLCLPFVVLAVLGVLTAPLVAIADAPGKVYRVGWLGETFPGATAPPIPTFRAGLQGLGFVEGKNLLIEVRSPEGKLERLPQLAIDLARAEPHVILAVSAAAARAAVAASKTIPVVFMLVDDPVGNRLVASPARPGGNMTGVTQTYADIAPKLLEFLQAAVPSLSRVTVLTMEYAPGTGAAQRMQTAARAMNILLQFREAQTAEDLERILSQISQEENSAVIVWPSRLTFLHRKRIAEVARA